LIAAIDEPMTGPRPVGPGRLVTALAGIIGGLVIGIGALFLSLPSVAPSAPEGFPLPASAWPYSAGEGRPRAKTPSAGFSFEKALAKSVGKLKETR
jgi:hypothetical protein